MNEVYGDKQLQLLRLWQENKLRRINVLEGSVRSGKTWISLVLWAFWVATMPQDGRYLMVAKTLTSLRRNVLDLLQELVGSDNFTYSLSKKEGLLFGRLIYLEGVNDARAESKIRGMTLQGAYCDELTLFTEDFFTMLLSRLSLSSAKLIGTTNPDNPHHWLMEKYIKRTEELDMLVMKFLIEDNIFLDKTYVENLKKEYTGVFYERYILGLWKAAEGLIYDMFDEDSHTLEQLPEVYAKYYVSVDYGTQNPTVFLLWGKSQDIWYCIKEYYYSGRAENKQKTDGEFADDLDIFLGEVKPSGIIVDPSAASFIAELKKRGRFIKKADNDVVDGIRLTGQLISAGKIIINKSAKETIKEFFAYVWDKKAVERGEDKPLKENDHCMDAVRYFCYTVLKSRQARIANKSEWGIV